MGILGLLDILGNLGIQGATVSPSLFLRLLVIRVIIFSFPLL